jgi:RNA-directed DNA polymerase
VDRVIWDTPEKKMQAVHELKRWGYQPQPLRRVYILKSDALYVVENAFWRR